MTLLNAAKFCNSISRKVRLNIFAVLPSFLLIVTSSLLADDLSTSPVIGNSAVNCSQQALNKHFQSLVADINQTLAQNKQLFQSSPKALVEYVDKQLIAVWSAEKSLVELLGKKAWNQLPASDKADLMQNLNNTLQRYSQEGITYYNGQQLKFVRLRLNQAKTRGILTLELAFNQFLSVNFNAKIALIGNQWLLYDVLYEGISYISTKKFEYRKILAEQGTVGLNEFLQAKNKGYLSSNWPLKQQHGSANRQSKTMRPSVRN